MRQMHDQRVTTILMGGDGISNSEFGAIGGDGAVGTLMTSFPDPATFVEAKDAVADLRPSNVPTEAVTLYAYAAAQIIADAIVKAKSYDTQGGGGLSSFRRHHLYVLGPISYDSKGDIKQPGFVVFEWQKVDGKLHARRTQVEAQNRRSHWRPSDLSPWERWP